MDFRVRWFRGLCRPKYWRVRGFARAGSLAPGGFGHWGLLGIYCLYGVGNEISDSGPVTHGVQGRVGPSVKISCLQVSGLRVQT